MSRPRPRSTIFVSSGLAIALAVSVACSDRRVGSVSTDEPSLVLVGADVVTLDPERPRARAVAIRGSRITSLGEPETVLAAAGPAARVVRLDGRVVTPAFVDHHVHLLNVGLSLRNQERDQALFLDLSGLDRDEIAARVADRAAELPAGSWILGKGWSQGVWGAAALPDHEVLTRAAPEHPVFLTRVDGHAGWANRAALVIAGIDAETPDPAGGAILRRPDGSPSGVLLESANERMVPHLPEPSDRDVVAAFRLATDALASQGVAEAFDAGFLPMPGIVGLDADLARYLDLLVQADRESPLAIRVHLMVPAPSELTRSILADPARYRDLSPRVGVTHLKLFADGALGSRGAALSRPYADDPSTAGVTRMGEAELREWSERALDAGLDVAIHAIGDLAIRRTLITFGKLLRDRPGTDPRRLRLEHFSFASAEDFERAADIGIVLSVQPNFVIPDDEGATMEDARIGKPDVERVYAWKRALGAGAILAFGSDYFTTPAEPLRTVHAAVTRQNAGGAPPDGWHPLQRLDPRAALSIMTRAVEPGGVPGSGSLRPGASADLAVLSADPLTAPESDLLEIQVVATLERGRVVFDTGVFDGQ